jgi:hypothetical protein
MPVDASRSQIVQGQHLQRLVGFAILISIAAIALSGCLSGSDEDSASADSALPANAAPSISGSPPTAVNVDESYSFVPSATDANDDALQFSIENKPLWITFNQDSGKLSGRPTAADVGVYSDILLSVSDGSASASLPRFSISVDQVGNFSTTLSWTAPTQNEDGSTLTDLAGYKLYWGTGAGDYSNSVTIDTPGITTYVVENLSAGTYEFVATSFNEAGVESVYSNTAVRVLQ